MQRIGVAAEVCRDGDVNTQEGVSTDGMQQQHASWPLQGGVHLGGSERLVAAHALRHSLTSNVKLFMSFLKLA